MDRLLFTVAVSLIVLAAIYVPAFLKPMAFLKRPRLVLLGVGMVSVLSAGTLLEVTAQGIGFRTHLDASETPLLLRGDPARDVFQQAVATFGDDDIYVVSLATEDGVFSKTGGHLRALRDLAVELRKIGGVRSVDVLPDVVVPHYDARELLVEVAPFLPETIPSSQAELDGLRKRALAEPIIAGILLARDAKSAAIQISFLEMDDREFVARGIDAAIRNVLLQAETPSRRVFVTGRPHIKTLAHDRMARDLSTLVPAAVLVGALTARVVTGSLRAGVVPVGASLIATLITFGLLAGLGRPLTLITLVLAPLLICVGSVYGVHVLARFDELDAELPETMSATEVALACHAAVRLPVTIAGATTCAGFAALATASTDAVRELGLLSLFGVAAVCLLSLAALPALLAVMGRRPRSAADADLLGASAQAGQAAPSGWVGPWVDRLLFVFSAVVRRSPNTVLIAWVVMTALAVVQIPRINIDTDYLKFFAYEDPVREDFRSVSDTIAGAVPLYVTLRSDAPGTFRDPKALLWLEGAVLRLREDPEVDEVQSVLDFLRSANRALEGGSEDALVLPASEGSIAEVFLLLPKNRLRRFVSSDRSAANLLLRSRVGGSAEVRKLEGRVHAALMEQPPPLPLAIDVTGNVVVTNRGADGIASDQALTVSVATLVIFVLIAVSFGSPKLAALAMVPNVVPVLLFYGLLGTGFASLSLPTSLVGCIALGIAVDDTAHFLSNYRRHRARGLSPEEAAASCIRMLGRAIVATSAMLIAGFCVVGLSSFATLSEFGVLSAITMLLCLAADLVLLPALLIRARA